MRSIEIDHAPGGGFLLLLPDGEAEHYHSVGVAFLRAADIAGWNRDPQEAVKKLDHPVAVEGIPFSPDGSAGVKPC